MGLLWLIIEPIIGLTSKSIELTYWQFIGWAAFFGIVLLIIDGLWFSGFLRQRIEIKSNAFDTKIVVKFGDIFNENGWKAIAVNDFFDSIVDDNIVSSNSLHGKLLQKYWAGNIDDWNHQVNEELPKISCSSKTRSKGKQNQYKIGTTVAVEEGNSKFLCVALSHTCASNNKAYASSSDLLQAVRGLLQKARFTCSNESLSIPLMGSGSSGIGIKSNILVSLILAAVFEETKNGKVTNEIHIVLPKEKVSEINIKSLQEDWK